MGKITIAQAEEIRALHQNGTPTAELSERFGITRVYVNMIVRRENRVPRLTVSFEPEQWAALQARAAVTGKTCEEFASRAIAAALKETKTRK